ncbi:MAG TPA: MBL fold metallo-hydrolase [Anaerolineales bacterium]|nr:MBL fold metallo-hydrolase [Anaerolineales bacterium]
MMQKPLLQDEAFLADVRAAHPDQLHLWWLGQSGYLVRWRDSHLLIDPYLSDSLTQKYAGTSKPHVRMTERVISPERLDFIDVVTSSHNHTDHLDGDTLIPLLGANPALNVVVSRANLAFAAERLQTPAERLTPIRAGGDPIQIGPFKFAAIPSAHETLETDENGDHKFLGYLITVAGRTIYHSGDACLYEGLVERLKAWKIDLALLPINGRDPKRGVAGNFSAAEAVQLGKDIQAGLVVPCHYAMFEFNTVSPAEFTHLAGTRQVPYQVLQCGERLSLTAGAGS